MMTRGRFLATGMCVAALALSLSAQETEEMSPLDEMAALLAAQPETQFAYLVRVANIQGTCEVNNPDVGMYKPVKHNKAYPLGSTFRTGPGSSCFLVFSPEDSAEVTEQSEVMVSGVSTNSKTCHILNLKLINGTVKTALRDNLKGSVFNINTPNAEIKNMTGRGEYTIGSEGENEILQVATITGTASLEGPHYTIPALQAANTVNILTAPNRSFSRLTSVSGDFAIILHNGTEQPVNFGMSPQAIVKIWRNIAPVGGRTIVSTLVVSPTGMARHRFAYAEGRPILQTGELVETKESPEEQKEINDLLQMTTGDTQEPEKKKEEADIGF